MIKVIIDGDTALNNSFARNDVLFTNKKMIPAIYLASIEFMLNMC